MAPLASACVRPESCVAPSSGTAVVPSGPSPRRSDSSGGYKYDSALLFFPRGGGALPHDGGGDGVEETRVFLAPPTTECQDHPEQPIAIILNFNVALPPHGESLPKISP